MFLNHKEINDILKLILRNNFEKTDIIHADKLMSAVLLINEILNQY